MDVRNIVPKLRGNLKLMLVIVVCIIIATSIGAASVFMRSTEEERPYVLQAAITTDRTNVNVWEEVVFTANGSRGDIVSYLWDFGDGDVARGVEAVRSFPASAYYNIYLTVTDSKGGQDITMVNISVFNVNDETEATGAFLDSSVRRGPSSDGAYLSIYGGLTRPTVYVNFTGSTECAMLYLDVYLPDNYYSDTVVCAGDDLDVRLVFEDLELEEEYWADMYIQCARGYVIDYCLQMSVVY